VLPVAHARLGRRDAGVLLAGESNSALVRTANDAGSC
jgi:hypothetical protein